MKNILIKILIALSIISFSGINFIWNSYAEGIRTYISIDLSSMLSEECWEENWKFYCDVPKWFTLVTLLMWKIIKYFTYIAALAWVLFIVVNWILYSMWWADESFKTESKKRIIWTLVWLAVLMLSWVILNAVAPWIYVWG